MPGTGRARPLPEQAVATKTPDDSELDAYSDSDSVLTADSSDYASDDYDDSDYSDSDSDSVDSELRYLLHQLTRDDDVPAAMPNCDFFDFF